MMRKIAILSSKGGTGKTTTSINLAHGLALMGRSVL
ncbi:MAG TPA: AAA family ATPase, partial [Clostridiales bacterium]|nr:AAA family ATPase [Clostridiales bacterium]